MTVLVWLLAAVVALLAVLVVGLLRSHALIIRALHDAGFDLDPDHLDPDHLDPDHLDPDHLDPDHLDPDHLDPDHGASSSPVATGLDVRAPSAIPRPTVEIHTATPPDIRTIAGVPTPADATGRRAADIVGVTPNGGTRSISVQGGKPTLLAFLTTGCTTCASFWNAFADGVRIPADARLVIVTKGSDVESPADVAAMAPAGIVTVQSTQAWDDYRIPVAPYFVLIDAGRGVVVGEGAAHSWDLVLQLLERALADAGYGQGQVRRRDMLLGRTRADRVDRDLLDAGIVPGDPRLHHPPARREP